MWLFLGVRREWGRFQGIQGSEFHAWNLGLGSLPGSQPQGLSLEDFVGKALWFSACLGTNWAGKETPPGIWGCPKCHPGVSARTCPLLTALPWLTGWEIRPSPPAGEPENLELSLAAAFFQLPGALRGVGVSLIKPQNPPRGFLAAPAPCVGTRAGTAHLDLTLFGTNPDFFPPQAEVGATLQPC